jgi:curli biogenesis system outer membrane secretion channel CsgG
MRKLFSFVLVAALLCGASAEAQRAVIGIVPFRNSTDLSGRLAEALADMLYTELVKPKKFRVVDRVALGTIMEEQSLGQSGAVDPATAAQIGKLRSADYMVIGTVTEAGSSNKSGGIGYIKVGRNKVTLAVDIRFVDTTTGEALFAEMFRAENKKMGFKVGHVDFDGENPTGGEMGREVIQNISRKIMMAVYPAKISRVNEAGNEVVLNYGEVLFDVGEVWDVYRQGEEIVDFDTGEVIGKDEVKVGSISTSRVQASLTYATITEGDIQVGDVCRPPLVDPTAEKKKNKSGGFKNKFKKGKKK